MDILLLLLLTLLPAQWLERLVPSAQRWKEIQGGWAESSQSAASYVAWGLGILVAGAIVFAIVQNRREKKKRRERELKYFDRKAVEKELNRKHIDLLTQAVQDVNLEMPYRMLESYDVFQHVLEEYHKTRDFSEHEHKYFHQMIDEIKDQLGFTEIEEAVPLSTSEDIRKGQKVKIAIDHEGQEYEYPSELLYNTDERLTFDADDIELDYFNMKDSPVVEVQFYRENDAAYKFTTRLNQPPDSEKQELYLRHPQKLERIQARNFSRMEVRFRFSFYHIPKDHFNSIEVDINLDKCDDKPVFVAETIDISGGGIAFFTRRPVKKGDFCYLNFQQLSDEHTEPVLAEVVHTGKDDETGRYIVRAKYYSITEATQDAIMRFIYQMQRKAARRMKFAPKK